MEFQKIMDIKLIVFLEKGLDKWRRVCIFTKEKNEQFELNAIILFEVFNKNLIQFACR
jgi:hypothetical protein